MAPQFKADPKRLAVDYLATLPSEPALAEGDSAEMSY
jgi:hypothetical protein